MNKEDSGWRFFEGTESPEYMANNDNSGVYKVNTIANLDAAIIPYIHLPVGVKLERIPGTNKFREIVD
jgi:hypothetical protein